MIIYVCGYSGIYPGGYPLATSSVLFLEVYF